MASKKGIEIPITFNIEDATRSAETMGRKIEEALNRHKGTENPQIAQIMKSLEQLQEKIRATAKYRDEATKGSDNYQQLSKLAEQWGNVEEKTKTALNEYKEYLRSIGKGKLVDAFTEAPNAIDRRYFGRNRTQEISEQIAKLKELQSAWAKASTEKSKYEGMAFNAQPNPLTSDETQEIAKNFKTSADSAEIFLLKLQQIENASERLGKSSGNGTEGFRRNFYIIRTLTNDISKGINNLLGKFKQFSSRISDAVKNMIRLKKESSRTTVTLKDGFKKALNLLVRYGFGIRSLFFLFRRLRKYAIEALGEMAKQIPIVNTQMSKAAQSLNQMKGALATAIQPLLNVLVPALEKIAALVSKIMSIIGGVFAIFTGQKAIYTATATQVDYAASLDKTGAAAKKAKKELEGYLSPIDEINKYQSKRDDDDGSGGGGGGVGTPLFKYAESPIPDFAKKIANLINKLLKPLKEAWKKVGDFVKKSWKYAMDEVLKLGQSVARDFWKMWEQKATQQIFENILKTIGYIGIAVGNLAKRFREAWDKNNTGYKILCHIRDIILTITEHVKKMAKATADWADNLNFSPLLEGFEKWIKSLKKPVDAVMGVLEDLYTQVILPLGEWAIEVGGPKLLKVFEDFNKQVDWDGLREKLKELWAALEPFAETIGEGVILFIDELSDAVAKFLNSEMFKKFIDLCIEWMNKAKPEDVARTIKIVAGAITTLKGALFALEGIKALNTTTTAIKTFLQLFGAGGAAAGAGGIGTAIKNINDLKGGLVDLTGALDGWTKTTAGLAGTYLAIQSVKDVKDLFKVQTLKKEFDDGKISADEYMNKLKELDGLGKSRGSMNMLDSYMSECKRLKDELKDGKITMQEYQHEMSNLNQKYKMHDDSVDSLTKKYDDWHEKLQKAHDGHYANVQLMESANAEMQNYGKSIQVTAGAAKAAKTDTDAYNTSNKSLIDRIKENIAICKEYSSTMDNKVDPSLTDMKKTTTDTSNTMQLEMRKMGISVGNDISGVQDKLNGLKSSFDKNKWTFSGVAEGLGQTFRSAINKVGDFWNSFANSVNGQHEIFGKSFSINLPKIPRLAQGAVIPPNKEFMAVLGDQKSGTNIETPLQTMVDAFNTALSQNGRSGNGVTEINFLLPDRRRVAQYVIEGGKVMQTSLGRNPFDLA